MYDVFSRPVGASIAVGDVGSLRGQGDRGESQYGRPGRPRQVQVLLDKTYKPLPFMIWVVMRRRKTTQNISLRHMLFLKINIIPNLRLWKTLNWKMRAFMITDLMHTFIVKSFNFMGTNYRCLTTIDMLVDTWIRGFQIICNIIEVNTYFYVKGDMSDSVTNYNYVGNTKVSVSIKKTNANKCTLSEIFLTEILKSFSVF